MENNNLNMLIFAHLNINQIRKKLELLIIQIKSTVDVLMISEIEIDDSFLLQTLKQMTLVSLIGQIKTLLAAELYFTLGKIFRQI